MVDGERCGVITVEDAKCGSITTNTLYLVPRSFFCFAWYYCTNRAPSSPPVHRALTPLVSRNVGIPELIALLNKLGSNLVGSEPCTPGGSSSLPVQLILLLLLLVLALPLPTPDWPRPQGHLTREGMVAWLALDVRWALMASRTCENAGWCWCGARVFCIPGIVYGVVAFRPNAKKRKSNLPFLVLRVLAFSLFLLTPVIFLRINTRTATQYLVPRTYRTV